MKRRDFLKTTVVATAPMAIGGILDSLRSFVSAADEAEQTKAADQPAKGEMPYRQLGRTGQRVSILGLGGYHIGMQSDEQESTRIIRYAIDSGVNFMDNCWDYHRGGSETRMGNALKDGYRDKVFLMTKIDGRTKKAAAAQIDECLRRLQTDRIDLMQHHEIIRTNDPDRIFAPGGAQEAVLAAQKAGKIRFIGLTGHKDPAIHLRMLETAEKNGFHFDAVQMPLNVMDAHFRSFAKQVLPVLVKNQIGVLGMKSMGSGMILRSNVVTPAECLQYAMSLPTSAVICGMESMDVLRRNLELARSFKPLSPEAIAALLERTAKAAAEGRFEGFKTTTMFDGTAHNPQWLG
jgi:aryl-alcohol dehydrogenase-like predicted oxidoreductase